MWNAGSKKKGKQSSEGIWNVDRKEIKKNKQVENEVVKRVNENRNIIATYHKDNLE